MVNLLPAILVGGPPNAGKSVLFYHLTQALRERDIPHHAIRACPDGEGNWYHEGDPTLVDIIRTEAKLNGEWPPEFVERLCQDLEHRRLPFLVDLGGRPKDSQINLLRLCTHSILLLRSDKPDYTELWERLVADCNLLPLARLISELESASTITGSSPLLEGTLAGLDRHAPKAGRGEVFDALVERVAMLFGSYDPKELTKTALEQASTELVLNLEEAVHTFTPNSNRWETAMLQPFLESLPAQTPLSVYGAGPSWLYAALAAYTDTNPFYLYDPKLPFGWVQPAQVTFGETLSPEMHAEAQEDEDVTVLTITFPSDRLSYFQPDPLAFPSVPIEKGLIINGRVPNWLLTALMRLYKAAGVPWIAPFYVQLNRAVVSYSRPGIYRPGDLLPLPTFLREGRTMR